LLLFIMLRIIYKKGAAHPTREEPATPTQKRAAPAVQDGPGSFKPGRHDEKDRFSRTLFQNIKKKIALFPHSYIYKVGSFWIIYEVAFCLAVGEATSRKAAITVGIINYLWPGFIYLFALPLLKQKARPVLLVLGILTASSGAAAALMHGSRLSPADIFSTVKDNIMPYTLAFIAAISWGIYSNLVRKYKTGEDIFSLPVLCIISAGIILVVQLLKGEVPVLAPAGRGYLELAYLVIFPKALAYFFWYRAMRCGRKNLVTSFSFLVPLVSMLLSSLYLDVEIGCGFIAAAVLVLFGALLCKVSIIE
ncbi:MAG: EamA family transporter, partial [Candidatus Aminicenantes bacterium]|nr:EamA family transporter [Candidatus Aminicenantes bacterium]